MRVKRLDRLQSPRLALLALFLGPHDRLPVRGENETGAGVGDFDAVAAGLVDVEEEGLLDGVLVRNGLDVDAVLEKNVGGAQNAGPCPMSPSVQPISNPDPFSAATRRSSACALRARSAMCPMPDVFEAVSLSE